MGRRVYACTEAYRSVCADLTFPCKQSLPHSLASVNWVTAVHLHMGQPDLKSPPAAQDLGLEDFQNLEA